MKIIVTIITFLATVLSMGSLDNSKKGATENAAHAFSHAVENTIATTMIRDESFIPMQVQTDTKRITGTSGAIVKEVPIDFKGTGPTTMNLKIVNGVVAQDSTITINGYNYMMSKEGEWLLQS